jgi:hypothetical protein
VSGSLEEIADKPLDLAEEWDADKANVVPDCIVRFQLNQASGPSPSQIEPIHATLERRAKLLTLLHCV